MSGVTRTLFGIETVSPRDADSTESDIGTNDVCCIAKGEAVSRNTIYDIMVIEIFKFKDANSLDTWVSITGHSLL